MMCWKRHLNQSPNHPGRRRQQRKRLQRGKRKPMAKILLAEDDETMVSLLTTLLKMEGFEVVEVDVNADVPSMVRQEMPDAIFMDVHLGGKNGLQILESIRKNPDFANIRIVMTSGLNMREECLSLGASAFLLKPFMPDDLLNVLKQ